jgi:hypothetical protein
MESYIILQWLPGRDANHIARPRRLDRLKPLNRSRFALDSSGPVRDSIFIQVPRNPSISLHLDRLLSSMFFRMYVSRISGLLINTAQSPVLTDAAPVRTSKNVG